MALGFDHEHYARTYPSLGHLGPAELAAHYHACGRVERLEARFARSLGEGQALIETMALPEAQKNRLRLDIAAAASRQADIWGRSVELTTELLRPTSAHRPLLVIGDSHGQQYLTEDVLRAGGLLPAPFLCTGASARGLGNPASRARAGERIENHLRARRDEIAGELVLFKFGQVDLEFVYDYRRIREGRRGFDLSHAAEFARDCVRRYVAFLARLQAETPARLVVTAALPPALNDAALREGYMNAHIVELHAQVSPEALRQELQLLEMAPWQVRTGLAGIYNRELAAACAAAGLAFHDDFSPMLGPDGVIDPELILWHGGIDHHLCFTSPAARRAAAASAAALAALQVASA